MKSILLLSIVAITLLTTGCYSGSTKEPGSESTDQSAPTQAPAPSRSGGY